MAPVLNEKIDPEHNPLGRRWMAFPQCTKCGRMLNTHDMLLDIHEKCVPACQRCLEECKKQMAWPEAQWPMGWFGHVTKESSGYWHVKQDDGLEYDWPITSW